MLSEYIRNYLIHGLRASPFVVERLLRDATEEDLDRRPEPDRFTIREVVAHLADWDTIWQERITRMRKEDEPFLPDIDEGELAVEHDYSHTNLREQLSRFHRERAKLADLVAGMEAAEWSRNGRRNWGSFTIAEMVAMVLGHDGYHTRQIDQWLKAGGH